MALDSKENNGYIEKVRIATEIFNEYGDFIHQVICSKVKKETEVDEIYQNLFLSIASRRTTTEIKNIKGYLYRAIIHDIYDENRKKRRYRDFLKKYTEYIEFSVNKTDSKDVYNTEGRLGQVLKCAQNQLAPKELKAVVLRYIKSCSTKEVADILQIKPASAREYISSGLGKIRNALKKERGQTL